MIPYNIFSARARHRRAIKRTLANRSESTPDHVSINARLFFIGIVLSIFLSIILNMCVGQ